MAPKRTGPRTAIALGYDKEQDSAPKVLASGRGEIAAAILQRANEHGVPIHADHPLANALIKLEIGESIPPELYAAVAEVLAFLWRMELRKAGESRASGVGGREP